MHAGSTAIGQYFFPAGPTAANQTHAVAAVDSWDKQGDRRTVGRTPYRYIDHAAYTHTPVSRYQKSKTNLDFTEARDSEWQWHQLGHNYASLYLAPDR